MDQEIKQFHEGDEDTYGNHKILIFILFALFLVVCVIVFGYYFLNGRGKEIVNDNKDIMQVEQVSNMEVDSEEETIFEKNEYVEQFYSAEKNVLRIPYEFLVSKNVDGYEFYGDDDKFYELDLNEHPLPLNNLVSFVVSPDSKKIAYMVYDGEDYCENKKGYIYDIDTKESVEIDDSKTLNACGAVSASISHFSSGGRFLYIHVGGPGSFQYFLYDSYKKVGRYNEDSIIYGDNEEYIIYTEGSNNSTCSIDSEPLCLNDIVKWENLDTGEERVIFDIDGESGYMINDFQDEKLSVNKFKQRSQYGDYKVLEIVVDDEQKNISENWNIYKNEEIGVSFIYPDDWILEKGNGNKTGIENYFDLIYKKSTTQDYPDKNKPMDALINVNTISNVDKLTLQGIFNDQHDECEINVKDDLGCPPVKDVSEWKSYKIDGFDVYETGYKESVGEGGGLPQNFVYIDKDEYFILIKAKNFNLKNTYNPASVFEKIISSIRILN